jgi:hypothetical protein
MNTINNNNNNNKTRITDTRLEEYIMFIFMVAGAFLCCMMGFTVMNMAFGAVDSDYDWELYKLHTGLYDNEIGFYLMNIEHEIK